VAQEAENRLYIQRFYLAVVVAALVCGAKLKEESSSSFGFFAMHARVIYLPIHSLSISITNCAQV
jgi:hypothetical protein